MPTPLSPLLLTGFLLGWSVAWPPGPINAEIARRCLAGGFWAGFSLLLGACSGDALWAVLVSLGVGVLFAAPLAREVMGAVSVGLLVALSLVFLRGAWRALRRERAPAAAPSRFDTRRASFVLGAAMALTSPWNVAFWLAAMGRPEMAGYATTALLVMATAVIAGALTWGVLWSLSVVLLRGRGGSGAARWWAFGVDFATGALMAYFAFRSAARLIAG
jgi:threonine/homoserine/homoserine lactone efflux protein